MSNHSETDIAVVGGGLVGSAIAFGLAAKGLSVVIFDEGDHALRASRGNFGLIWVQAKGIGRPEYACLGQQSGRAWPRFAEQLQQYTGLDLQLQQRGGLYLCQTETELQETHDMLHTIHAEVSAYSGEQYTFEILDHKGLKKVLPEIGPTVAGASLGHEDGHVNPLVLLRALHSAYKGLGGKLVNFAGVESVTPDNGGFRVKTTDSDWWADKVVLAAGLGNATLAPGLGLNAPVEPLRGQLIITERVAPFLNYPTEQVRQTGDGTLQLGASHEEVGFDISTTADVCASIAKQAITFFPHLKDIKMVRSWGALRVMTPDGFPIYQESATHPGAFVVTCHSGVTLAPIHAGIVADWIAGGSKPDQIEVFHDQRF